MTGTESSATGALTKWQVEQLRFTSFNEPESEFSLFDWWENIVGEGPEAELNKPKEHQIVHEGPYKGGKLVLTRSLNMIDLRFVLPSDRVPEAVGGVPTLGLFDDLLPDFLELCKKLLALEAFPSVTRMAFGSIIDVPVTDRREGYSGLTGFLPDVSIDVSNTRDFAYRINRRRDSGCDVKGLSINRLSKWAVSCFANHTIPLGTEAKAQQPPELHYAYKLDVDINTCQEFEGELPEDKHAVILDELVSMGQEIMEKGDIP